MKKIIDLKNITVSYGDNTVLENLNLYINEKEFITLLGPSGCGKTTTLRAIAGFVKPDSGDIIFEGKRINDLPAHKRRVNTIFQRYALFSHLNVYENIAFGPQLQKKPKEEVRQIVADMLKLVNLKGFEKRPINSLSGGQQQRVAIARALASNPKILLCDEATSALDPQTTASILELLKSINEQFQITIVIITHQMSVIREICNRVAIIEHGELVENGLVEDIFSHPKSKAARELILRDVPENSGKAEGAVAAQMERIQGDKKLRIVFTENSAFEPVIANMILQFGKPVNILRADTKNVGGVAKGEMILGLPDDRHLQIDMEQYLTEHGLEIEEVTGDVE